MDYGEVERKLLTFIQGELKATSLDFIVLGLSGGLDSSVVAVLAKKALKRIGLENNLLAVMMPTSSSQAIHMQHAKDLCKSFDIDYSIVPIDDIVKSYFKKDGASSLRIGNFSARARMSILYDISSFKNGVVIGTSNKSELALGYGTLYGDLACAFNPIGNIYKSELFGFAKYLGICDEIINKAPSADLWEGQSDEKELGFTYKQIDEVLRDFLDNSVTKSKLLEKKYNKKLVDMVVKRYNSNRFKRRLPNIAKL